MEEKVFPINGKEKGLEQRDAVPFLQLCPHSLQMKPIAHRATFLQHNPRLDEGGPCVKGKAGGSESFILS